MAASLEMANTIKIKLNELSCPFTWELNEMASMYYRSRGQYISADTVEYDDEDVPILVIIQQLMRCYENLVSADIDSAGEKLQAAELWLKNIEQSEESPNIIRTIEHVVYATKCHFLYEAGKEQELETVLQDIVDVSNFTNEEEGALYGCKSTAFSFYHDFGIDKAIDAGTIAVEKDGDNPAWHYILATNLRRKRRRNLFRSSPCELECKHFETAFILSNCPAYGISFAQMKHETLHNNKIFGKMSNQQETEKLILEIYNTILDSNTKMWRILLKAALGYIRIHTSDQTDRAERCLDVVDEMVPNNSCALHYRGLIHRNRNDLQGALTFFKKAADLNNYIADINYAEYGWELGSVDPLEHLLGVLTKYSDLVTERLQDLLLNIATCYLKRNDDINAAKYYLKAIDVDPNGLKLTCIYKFLKIYHRFGTYHFLQRKFLPRFRERRTDATTRGVINQLQQRCRAHFNKTTEDVAGLLDNVKI